MLSSAVSQQKVLRCRKRSAAPHVHPAATRARGTRPMHFHAVTSHLPFVSVTPAAARKSCYATDAHHSTFQFRQRAIVQRFQILLYLRLLLGAFLRFSLLSQLKNALNVARKRNPRDALSLLPSACVRKTHKKLRQKKFRYKFQIIISVFASLYYLYLNILIKIYGS